MKDIIKYQAELTKKMMRLHDKFCETHLSSGRIDIDDYFDAYLFAGASLSALLFAKALEQCVERFDVVPDPHVLQAKLEKTFKGILGALFDDDKTKH